MAFTYTIGRNCQLVLLWNGTRVNSTPVEFTTPSGWGGEFTIDRGNSAVDDLVAAIESAFWSAGTIGSGTIYQYVTEPDGSLSTYEFSGVSLVLSNAGNYQADVIVRQKIGFFASQRVKL